MILRTLVANELLKMVKRRAFRMTLLLYAGITSLAFGGEWYAARQNENREYALPEAWASIYDEPTVIGLIFGCALMILLISAEFSWRTARQNVIDGLTKEQFFWAKALVIVIIAPIFMVAQTIIGGAWALAGTESASGPLFGLPQLSFLLGLFVTFVGYGTIGLLCATTIRASGPAVAVWFFYTVLGEQFLQLVSSRFGEVGRQAMDYFPIESFNELISYLQHDPVAFQAYADRLREAGRPVPEAINLGASYGIAMLWILILGSLAFFVFRKRDL